MNSMNGNQGYRGSAGSSQGQNMAGNNFKEKIPSGYSKGQIQNFTPEMMELFQRLFSHVGSDSFLSKLASGDESNFEEMEAPAWRQFQQAQGDLASRFSGMGMGARKGSGFQNAINQQSSDFAMGLQSQRQNLQRQAVQDLRGFSGELLSQKPYENYITPKEPSFFDKWLGLAGNVMGTAAKGASMGGF